MDGQANPRKIFARSPNSAMWLAKGGGGEWVAQNDFGKAWAFDSKDEARAAWALASRGCLERCALDRRQPPAWTLAEPALIEGRTAQSPPSAFEYWLGLVGGRFVALRGGELALSADEREAWAFGTQGEAEAAVGALNAKRGKPAAVLPMRCAPGEPVAVGPAPLDALAQAICAKSLREGLAAQVPEAKGSAKGSGSGRL